MAMVAPVKKANTKAVKIKSLRIAFPFAVFRDCENRGLDVQRKR
jgi:hypothetical protein